MRNVSLFKRSNSPSYFIQYIDDEGNRKSISTRCHSKSEALRFLSDFKSEQKNPKSKSKSLSEFTADLLLYANSQYRPTTVGIYKFALSLLRDSVGNTSMNNITPRHVDKWKAELLSKTSRRGGKLSAVYMNIHFRALKASFNTALRWGDHSIQPLYSL